MNEQVNDGLATDEGHGDEERTQGEEPCPVMAVVTPGRPWALCVDERASFSHGPLYDPILQRGTKHLSQGHAATGRAVAQGRGQGTVTVLSFTPSQR